MNLLKMYKPTLLADGDGNLAVHVALGGVSVWRKLPPDFKTYAPSVIESFLNNMIPPMIDELKALRKDKLLKLKRKARNEGKKRRGNTSERDPSANGGSETPPDGAA